MSKNTSSSSGGIGFVGLLQIVFITLKLCGVITWSWWYVMLPMFISTVVLLFVVLVLAILYLRR